MTDAEFFLNLIITLLSEDPTKIIDAMEDAEQMIAAGADMGASKHELMAEYCIYAVKRMNEHIPEMADVITLNEREIENGLIAYFQTIADV